MSKRIGDMKKIIIIIFISFGVISAPVFSSDYHSVGKMKCKDITEALITYDVDINEKITDWANGYVTGRNYPDNNIAEDIGTDWQVENSLLFMIRRYCRDHPWAMNIDAMEHIYNNRLQKNKIY